MEDRHDVDRITKEGKVFVRSTGLVCEIESTWMAKIDVELAVLPSG